MLIQCYIIYRTGGGDQEM
jgi:ubiquitin C-terminal hydrolase